MELNCIFAQTHCGTVTHITLLTKTCGVAHVWSQGETFFYPHCHFIRVRSWARSFDVVANLQVAIRVKRTRLAIISARCTLRRIMEFMTRFLAWFFIPLWTLCIGIITHDRSLHSSETIIPDNTNLTILPGTTLRGRLKLKTARQIVITVF